MRLKHTFFLSILVFTSFLFIFLVGPLFVASVGGGGGGGGSGGGSSSSGGGTGGGGSSLPFFSNLKCDESGTISFSRKPVFENVTVEYVDGGYNLTNIPGVWDGTQFTSDEAVIRKPGKYLIRDPVNNDRTVECPGLVFSCKLMQLNIQECIAAEKKVTVRFTLENASIDDMKYQFQTKEGKKLSYQKGSYSSELKGLTVIQEDADERNRFVLTADNVPAVSSLQITHPKCVGKYYTYSTISCTEKGKNGEITGKELKCGGYLDIEDRVKCRLSLREEEKNEYENFFPEECKARTDPGEQESCLKVYQAVQECWDFPNGPSRISCVKKQLILGDIFTEKANCNALDAGKRENCNKELREKAYALIKFRLYNLEEEAEKLMEAGKLTEEEVAAFVVQMEKSKLSFNAAKAKEERRQIILQARKYWIELVRKVKE